MNRTQFVNVCLRLTTLALIVTAIAYYYGKSIKDRTIWLSSKAAFPWEIAGCFLAYYFGIPGSKPFAFFTMLTFFVYGVADIIIELGDAMLAAGAIAFLVGHIVFIVAIIKSRKIQSEANVPWQGSRCVRITLAIVFAVIYLAITVFAVHLVSSKGGDISLIAISVIYPLSFAVMTVLGICFWRRTSSIVLTIIGGLVYAASDVCTALQALGDNTPFIVRFIMPSYWVALILLACSALPLIFHAASLVNQSENEGFALEVIGYPARQYPVVATRTAAQFGVPQYPQAVIVNTVSPIGVTQYPQPIVVNAFMGDSAYMNQPQRFVQNQW